MDARKIRSALRLVPLKAEGKAMHPDHWNNPSQVSDEQYLKQLQAYKDWRGDAVYKTACSRSELLKKLK